MIKLACICAAICLSAEVNAQSTKYTLEKADSLFRQYQLADSHSAYQYIASNNSFGDSIRLNAYEKLADQDWKFYTNYTAADLDLKTAATLKGDKCGVDVLQAAIKNQAGYNAKARTFALQALQLAKTGNEKTDAGLAFARAVHDVGYKAMGQSNAINVFDLRKGASILRQILEKQPGNSDASELLLGIALLMRDGNTALDAWRSYYLVSNERDINQVLKAGYSKLKPVLSNWKGKVLNTDQLITLAEGFAYTKFFDYANIMVAEVKRRDIKAYLHSKKLNDIAAYYTYIKEVGRVNDKIYPQVARGRTHYEHAYDSLMNIPAKKCWYQLSFIPKDSKFDPDTFYNEMNRNFDMEGYNGSTVGYYGMMMGHIIHKELKQVKQYGYSTKFTYISVDRLMSRDFTSWYGTTNVGGWGDSTTIIQVRKAYMNEPFDLLNWMTDSTAHRNILADIAKKKKADYTICTKDPYAEPKFLALYLKFNEATKLYKHLRDSGLNGTALNIAFVNEIFRLTIQSTVFAHEGRHAIDQLYFPQIFKAMSDDERELRAKYSEVIYSYDPKMAFTGSIMGSDLNESTNHGKANKRFRKLIVEWMTAHECEITGLAKNVPLLMQFDLLTDGQLRAICKSEDPMAVTGKD